MKNKIIPLITTGITWALAACSQPVERPANMQTATAPVSFYNFKMKSIDGEEIDFNEFKGKKVLLVNVASECGNTPQYTDLEKLHEQYGDRVTVLGFPANNFGGQEPGSNADIKSFCIKKYDVKFKMFEKISVKGSDKDPLYQWLSDKTKNGWNDKEPDWNFAKYLVDENGELVEFFPARTKPLDEKILSKIK
jgi:glutathione peroxidase